MWQADRQWYVALVNTREDEPAKLLVAPAKDASLEGRDLYTHAEVAFFRALVPPSPPLPLGAHSLRPQRFSRRP